MRLRTVRVKEFRSIWNSNEFDIEEVTCLVGKNEAGKTGLLKALYRLNPLVETDARFDVTEDYPRAYVKDYTRHLKSGGEHSTVVEADFALEPSERQAIEADFGKGFFGEAPEINVSRGYDNKLDYFLDINEQAAVVHFVSTTGLPQSVAGAAAQTASLADLGAFLEQKSAEMAAAVASAQAEANEITDPIGKAAAVAEATALGEPQEMTALRQKVAQFAREDIETHIWKNHILPALPKFLYFDEYYQMEGQVNIEALKARQTQKTLRPSDHPMLGLIGLADLELDQIINAPNTQELKNQLEGAGNYLSRQILQYWSQNKHISLRFDVRPGKPGDPPEMQTGTNLWAEVYDSAHLVTVRVGTRSRGFVWFFSFLAWFSQQQSKGGRLILLLDEPGLFLHATAQRDLLDYIDAELNEHQVIYTTHSPFMVEVGQFDRVRIVRDRSMEEDKPLPKAEEGTKVFTDILEADEGTLFPLQGALAYDITQTLFVGPNTLIVEGVSDLLYLPALGEAVQLASGVPLDPRWTITPVGGIDKVPTFVALLGAQKGLKIATLLDLQKKDYQKVENLYKQRLLKKSQVLTFADFTSSAEADIEDMFDRQFYLDLVNTEYKAELPKPIELAELGSHPRILVNIESWVTKNPLKSGNFNHYRPARYFAENASALAGKLDAATIARFDTVFKTLNALLTEGSYQPAI